MSASPAVHPVPPRRTVAVIGGGPAGLMAAEVLSAAGLAVTVYERMPTVGRKFLMAGRGGLNLTHSEDLDAFLRRYGEAGDHITPLLEAFPPRALIDWAEGLGQATFVGTSGRVFPKALKASPLLRAWLARLQAQGVEIRTRREWLGWTVDGALAFRGPDGEETARPDAVVLALGGASWPKLGSDGGWAPRLAARGVPLTPFESANCGVTVGWSNVFRERFAGEPLKGVALGFGRRTMRGEALVTAYGLEGGAVYALSADLRHALAAEGSATLRIDLRPDMGIEQLTAKLGRPGAGQSLSNILRKAVNLPPVAINLLREAHGRELPRDPATLAAMIKAVPIAITGLQPLARAISTAGGVAWSGVDDGLGLRAIPGVHVAGEMLDWEAPTGGYLLQACFASGVVAARAVLAAAD